MLVLTRKVNEIITLGNPLSEESAIEVTVVEVHGDQVRLGITAPRETTVHRKEVWLLLRQQAEQR